MSPPRRESEQSLRAWLEHVAQTAIDWLDALDAAVEGREDDEREIISEDDIGRVA